MALGAVIPFQANDDASPVRSHVNLSTPAGWAFIYWMLAVGILAFMFLTV
jgi:hypothetical protein